MKKLLIMQCTAVFVMLGAFDFQNSHWDKKARPSKSDAKVMTISSKVFAYSLASPYIPVDPVKKYRLSGKFRLAKPLAAKPGILKFGLQTYDKNKRPVLSEETTVVNRTYAKLISAAEYGGRQVIIDNGKFWRIVPNFSYIAFDALEDFSDLPNRSVVPVAGIKKLADGKVEVELKQPLRTFHKAGSGVRLHHRLASFLYGGALNKKLGEHFQAFSGIFTGEQRGGSHNIFRKGTAFIRVVVMIEGAGVLEFKDIRFEELP